MRLNQVIAIVSGAKTKVQKVITSIHHSWSKDRISGISRVYQPVDEDGEMFSPENRIVQLRVTDALSSVKNQLANFIDLVVTQETANTNAMSDVIVKGEVILNNVPVTVLLFLEKQLVDLYSLACNLPVLAPDKVWTRDEAKHCWVTETERTTKTNKKIEVIVKYEATKEHPAQTELVSLDKTIGHWDTVHLSGALPQSERDRIVDRIDSFRNAVKIAREAANNTEINLVDDFGQKVLEHVFG